MIKLLEIQKPHMTLVKSHIPGNSLSHQKTVNGNLFIPSMLF